MSRKLDGIKVATEIAEKHDGRCLSEEYMNNSSLLLWECKEKHSWKAKLANVKYSTWCPECANIIRKEKKKIDGLKIAQEIAKSNSGKCLSDIYVNNNSKMLWQCNDKHIWRATLSSVKNRNSWCRKCADIINSNNYKIDGLGIGKEIANERNGNCLSTIYTNNATKMKWKCAKGHTWDATLGNIKDNNRWCPECGVLKRARSSNTSYILTHWKTGEEVVCVASYEKKTVEYFNKNKINFRWQPRSFLMPNGKKYYPDCYLFSTKKWIEIKGYFWGKAEEKWDWFHSKHPNSELWNESVLEFMGIL